MQQKEKFGRTWYSVQQIYWAPTVLWPVYESRRSFTPKQPIRTMLIPLVTRVRFQSSGEYISFLLAKLIITTALWCRSALLMWQPCCGCSLPTLSFSLVIGVSRSIDQWLRCASARCNICALNGSAANGAYIDYDAQFLWVTYGATFSLKTQTRGSASFEIWKCGSRTAIFTSSLVLLFSYKSRIGSWNVTVEFKLDSEEKSFLSISRRTCRRSSIESAAEQSDGLASLSSMSRIFVSNISEILPQNSANVVEMQGLKSRINAHRILCRIE